jgi:hypothetical protein
MANFTKEQIAEMTAEIQTSLKNEGGVWLHKINNSGWADSQFYETGHIFLKSVEAGKSFDPNSVKKMQRVPSAYYGNNHA